MTDSDTRSSVILSNTAVAQLTRIQDRYNLPSRNAAINFAVASAYYELIMREEASQGASPKPLIRGTEKY